MDEQPPNRPPRPRPQPARRRPAGRSRAAAAATAAPRRRSRPPAPPRRRPPVDHGAEGDEGRPPPKRSQARLVVTLTVLTVLVISLAGFGLSLSSGSDPGPAPAPENTPVPVTRFSDPETGASLEYPRAWRRVEVPNATYRLVLDGGNNVAMTLRVFTTEVATTAANLENIKSVTDGIVTSNSTVQILKQQAISLNNMVGYYYFYTFTDDAGLSAVHAHYFLFQGRKMNMIVFQTLAEDFESYAATFDRIAESFHSDPNVGVGTSPASSTPTTSATSTTAG